MADPISLTAMAVIAGVAEVGKAYGQVNAAEATKEGLELQGKQNTVAYQQQTLSNYDVTQKLLDRQTAEMTTRGVAFSSPSFNAIQRNTVNVGAKEAQNLETEHNIFEENIAIEKRNVKDTLFANLFGDIAETGMSFASLATKFPSKV